MLNTVFLPEFIRTRIDSISGNIEEMIPTHVARWFNDGEWPNSATNWINRLNQMKSFANFRSSKWKGISERPMLTVIYNDKI